MTNKRYYVAKTKPLDNFKTIMHQVLVAGPMLENDVFECQSF